MGDEILMRAKSMPNAENKITYSWAAQNRQNAANICAAPLSKKQKNF